MLSLPSWKRTLKQGYYIPKDTYTFFFGLFKIKLLNETQELSEEEIKKKKGVIYALNLFFLILSIPVSIFLIIPSLLAGSYIVLFIILGLSMVIMGFIFSTQREKNIVRIEKSKKEVEKEIKKRKVLEILVSFVGICLIATAIGILSTIEFDLW